MSPLAGAKQILRPRVVFSGIQPTGVPHLGNYVGALRQWVNLQHEEKPSTKLIYSIVDLHAITVPQKPDVLKQRKREVLAALLAIGLDPERCTIFYQSSVRCLTPAHSLQSSYSSPLDVGAGSLRADVDTCMYRVCRLSLKNDTMEGR